MFKEKMTYNISEMFSEIEQEEIINKFLDDININETEKIIKKEMKKHTYNPVELFRLNLPNNALKLINDYGKSKCLCNDCCNFYHIILAKNETTYRCKGKSRKTYWNKANLYFSKLYIFPDEETIKKEFKINKKKYGLLDLLFSCFITNYDELQKDITQNVAEKITKLRYSVNKTIDELNTIMKYMYDNNYNKYEHIKLNYYPEIKL